MNKGKLDVMDAVRATVVLREVMMDKLNGAEYYDSCVISAQGEHDESLVSVYKDLANEMREQAAALGRVIDFLV